MSYTPAPAFGPGDGFAVACLLPSQLRSLYAICLQAQKAQQTAPDEFFDSKEISADAAALAGLCLNELARLSTESVHNLPDLTAEG